MEKLRKLRDGFFKTRIDEIQWESSSCIELSSIRPSKKPSQIQLPSHSSDDGRLQHLKTLLDSKVKPNILAPLL